MSLKPTAIQTVLAGLIDYAGLYPPAALEMRPALDNYRRYRSGNHAAALGRFIVDIHRLSELRTIYGDIRGLKLSVILSPLSRSDDLAKQIDSGFAIEAVEAKSATRVEVEQIAQSIPTGLETYIEVPLHSARADLLTAISDTGARVKLRTGGVVPDAFPPVATVARALHAIARAGVSFKATAGLHHPIRASHRMTYALESPSTLMHGFINLLCATALLNCGADVAEAERALEEQDPGAWNLTPETLVWRSQRWNTKQLLKTRETFTSFGSCSFEEPILDLEALGWL